MKNINPLLLTDFYKTTHMEMYNPDIEYITSYFTPRMTRLEIDEVIHFGLQGVIKEYLIDAFNENFFGRERAAVISEYKTIMTMTLGDKAMSDAAPRVAELYDLGYLPISINGLAEGSRVPMGVPTFSIHNTHPRFAWLVNALETLLSTSMWHRMISATIADQYAQIVKKYADITMEVPGLALNLLGDFSFRGQESVESGTASSLAFLSAGFTKTATIPAILTGHEYYGKGMELNEIGVGSISTEHSVMCSNYSIDGDETTFVKRLLTEIYPNDSFSMVADSYDYWNMVDVILPSLSKEIEEHNGTLLVRGDSGDPVDIVTKTVMKLWASFGGTVNSRGYKVLNPKIRVIYGDSITLQRAEAIYSFLERKGFSIENVVLGVGSFSMQAIQEGDNLLPFTRDTFGIAIKATHAMLKDESEIFILKDPKTDTGNFKKSHQGLVQVWEDKETRRLYAVDEVKAADFAPDLMNPVLLDGKLQNEINLNDVRERMSCYR